MKVGLCAIAKNENRYIREWVEYYKKLGVYHIFLYDNNDVDGERFDSVIKDYMDSGFVEVIDVRGMHKVRNITELNWGTQADCYNGCYHKKLNGYDWCMFLDIDEFITLTHNKSINDFLSSNRFNNFSCIQVNWVNYGDNNLLLYENKPVLKRFTKRCDNQFVTNYSHLSKSLNRTKIKSIIRPGINGLRIQCHNVNQSSGCKCCNSAGVQVIPAQTMTHIENDIYIKHFITKTIEEYFERKYKSTSATGIDSNNMDFKARLKCFFDMNTYSIEKELVAKKFLNK